MVINNRRRAGVANSAEDGFMLWGETTDWNVRVIGRLDPSLRQSNKGAYVTPNHFLPPGASLIGPPPLMQRAMQHAKLALSWRLSNVIRLICI